MKKVGSTSREEELIKRKFDSMQKYIAKLAKIARSNNVILPGRAYWTFIILLNSRDKHEIKRGIKRITDLLIAQGVHVPRPTKKVKDFLEGKIGYPE